MPKTQESVALRRSSRLRLRVPVIVSGISPDGSPFDEETYLLNIGKYGAAFKTRLPLELGTHLRVRPKNRRDAGLIRVVWKGEQGSPWAEEVGVEYVEGSNFLGIFFPD